jgi:putative transposase
MSWISIWVHLVFSTKNREPYLCNNEIRKKVFQHIRDNANGKNIWIDTINGYHEHAHCLISFNKEQSISQIAQLIKGESSNWINKNKLTKTRFLWQDDYWAVSVSESHLKEVRKYILEQEEHHKKVTFNKEAESFMDKYSWGYLR